MAIAYLLTELIKCHLFNNNLNYLIFTKISLWFMTDVQTLAR